MTRNLIGNIVYRSVLSSAMNGDAQDTDVAFAMAVRNWREKDKCACYMDTGK